MNEKTLKVIEKNFDEITKALRFLSNAVIDIAIRVLSAKEYQEFVDSLTKEKEKHEL